MINHPRKRTSWVKGMVIGVMLIYELGMIKFHVMEFYVNKDGRSCKRGSHHLRKDTTNLPQSSNILVMINYILPQSISTHVFTHCSEVSPHLDFKHYWFRASINGGTHSNKKIILIFWVSLWLSCRLSYLLTITYTWTTTTIIIAPPKDGVIIVIPTSLEATTTMSTSMAWEGRTWSLGATRSKHYLQI